MAEQDRVAIVGAGPVGLTLALLLGRAGIPTVVLEAEADIAEELRASTFHPPTLDMLDTLGLAQPLIAQGHANIRFVPLSGGEPAVLPIDVRNSEKEGDAVAIGCRYVRSLPEHHRLVADLIFANADQWTQFQLTRRRNPGVVLGTLWFLRMSLFQTWRGLVYLFRGMRAPQDRSATATGGARA